MNERDKVLLEAMDAIKVAELEWRSSNESALDFSFDVGYCGGLDKAARIIAELRKGDHANTKEG